ncbi:MAG: hypothetical protein Q7S47_01935 [bacterium]|nr:hypothetical protein [bacterium]
MNDEDEVFVIVNDERLRVEVFCDLDQETLPCSSCKTGEGYKSLVDIYDVFDAAGNKIDKDDARWQPAVDKAKEQRDHDKVICSSCIDKRAEKRAEEFEEEQLNG